MMKLTLHTAFPDGLQDEWNHLLADSISHVPFLRFEYLKTWWENRGGGEWPDASLAIVTASQDGRLKGVAPLFHSSLHAGGPALLNLGCIEISDFLDILCRPDDLLEFTAALLPFLEGEKLPEWQGLHFYNLLEDSPSLSALKAASENNGWSYQSKSLQHSPYIPLPGDWETYLAGIDKKQRHEIRRKMRRSEEAGVPVDWYFVEDRSTLEGEMDDLITLMEFDADKAKFLTGEMRRQLREIIRCSFDAGCLQLAFLRVNGAKAAAYLSFDYLNRIWVYNSGINPEFREYSPGWVLLGYLLKWANDNGRSEFDFMRGNEDYKYKFGAVDRFVMLASVLRNHKPV